MKKTLAGNIIAVQGIKVTDYRKLGVNDVVLEAMRGGVPFTAKYEPGEDWLTYSRKGSSTSVLAHERPNKMSWFAGRDIERYINMAGLDLSSNRSSLVLRAEGREGSGFNKTKAALNLYNWSVELQFLLRKKKNRLIPGASEFILYFDDEKRLFTPAQFRRQIREAAPKIIERIPRSGPHKLIIIT